MIHRRSSIALAAGALALLGATLALVPSALAGPKVKTQPVIPNPGEILITGGITAPDFLPTGAAELFDPETQTFTSCGVAMKPAREEALGLVVPSNAASKLAGHLLLLDGEKQKGTKFPHLKSSSSYDPATGKFGHGPGLKKQVEDGAVVALGNGRFLIISGEFTKKKTEAATDTAVIFDAGTGKVTALKSKLTTPRRNFGAALISGCGCGNEGKVLIAGGVDANDIVLDSAELFDPVAGTFTAAGLMNIARNGLTATALLDGTVLICGGFTGPGNTTPTAEIYDPATGTFTLTSDVLGGTDMDAGRAFHTATRLPDGTVLVAGGEQDIFGAGDHTIANASIYDPLLATFTPTANDMDDSREDSTATLIAGTSLDGLVLITGGESFGSGFDTELDTATLYDPATQTFTATTGTMVTARSEHVALQIP